MKCARLIKVGFLVAAVICGAAAMGADDARYIEYRYEVEPGDTVWGIACRIATEEEDVRELVWRIEQDNQIKNANLTPGQELRIRVSESAKK